jgi:plasmid stability protein
MSVLQFWQMGNTLTVRLPRALAEWLERTAARTGRSQGEIVRDQLEKAKSAETRPFMRLAGAVDGPRDLSGRKGFSRS